MTTATIRIDQATLPDQFDRSRPNAVAEAIETALRKGGIAEDRTRQCQIFRPHQPLFNMNS